MFAQKCFPQDQSSGLIGQTLLGIRSLAELKGYKQFRAGVAYATLNGSRLLVKRLWHSPWRTTPKRWLISIDYGRTEPSALTYLSGIYKTELRIPNGSVVVEAGGFMPSVTFHPKAYAVDDIAKGNKSVFGTFIGSGNLTASGLLTGSECGVLLYWKHPSGFQKKEMLNAYSTMSWFETVWENATPVADIIENYAKRWKKAKPPIVEEDEKVVDLFEGGPTHVVAGDFALALASAKAFWIEVHELYKNRGATQAGNQVDTPRGTRVFFGFSPTAVARDTVLGQVALQNDGFGPVECSVRFANNQMDKVNLPVPGTDGPDSYDDSILLFDRSGLTAKGAPKFRLTVGTEANLKKWKADAAFEEERTMQSGRRYGVLF
jgi:HKD family nuclease